MYIFKDWKFYKEVSNEEILKILNWDNNNPNNRLMILGKPRNPEIQINRQTNADVPQAWEFEWQRYYNWLGAIQEAEYRGLHLPSDEELDNLEDDLKKLNQSNGFRHCWWSSTEAGNKAWYCFLNTCRSTVHCLISDKGKGLSVVCTEKPL